MIILKWASVALLIMILGKTGFGWGETFVTRFRPSNLVKAILSLSPLVYILFFRDVPEEVVVFYILSFSFAIGVLFAN